jgi:antitoxin (DNA-binding transcriptional repressor) of toxin-antitoxin stability system
MSVSELKNTLLEVVRRVEKGEVFEITKGGEPVALLSPTGGPKRSATGFASVEIKGALDLPAQEWTYDVENLKPRRKARR